MKKILLLAACAAMLGVNAAQADVTYTLTKQWMNENLTIATVSAWGGSARQGVGKNGVVYVQDNTNQNLLGYNASGAVASENFSTGAGWGVNVDESGNILAIAVTGGNASFRSDTTQIVLISADGKTINRLPMPSGFPEGRFDYVGKIAGNMFGEAATVLVGQNGQTSPTAITFANGAITGFKQVPVTGDSYSFNTQSVITYGWYDEAKDIEHYLLTTRSSCCVDLALSYGDDGLPSGAVATTVSFNTTPVKACPANAGVDVFQLGGKTYIAAPVIEETYNYRNPISIYTLIDNTATPVVTSDLVYNEEKIKGAGNFSNAEVVNETTANIYQYYTGNFVAEFTFSVDDNTGVNEVNAAKTVANVSYVNIAGQVSATPFDGLNIKVTNYTDGSKKAEKVMK